MVPAHLQRYGVSLCCSDDVEAYLRTRDVTFCTVKGATKHILRNAAFQPGVEFFFEVLFGSSSGSESNKNLCVCVCAQ